MSEDGTRITYVFDVDRDAWITINFLTDCKRCGNKASPHSPVINDDGNYFRVCDFHCLGCDNTSTVPNLVEAWMTQSGVLFYAPICKKCHDARQSSPIITEPYMKINK